MKWYETGFIGSVLAIPPFGVWFGIVGIILQFIGLAWLIICISHSMEELK